MDGWTYGRMNGRMD